MQKCSTSDFSKIIKGSNSVISAIGYSPLQDFSKFKDKSIFDILRAAPSITGSFEVENRGMKRLVDSVVDQKVPKVVLISSLLTNGFVSGQFLNPSFILLNLFGGILLQKRAAEIYLSRQIGVDFTILRPGGLIDEEEKNNKKNKGNNEGKRNNEGNNRNNTMSEVRKSWPIVYGAADTMNGGTISREKVAEVAVFAALELIRKNKTVCVNNESISSAFSSPLLSTSNKIIEIVTSKRAIPMSIEEGCASISTL
jgi:hypothetical protein